MVIFEALAARMAARKQSNADVLLVAARRLANNESADDAAIERAMLETGMTLEAFQSLVELCERRRDWRVELDRGPAATAKRDKAASVLEREAAAFEATQQAWFNRRRELSADLDAVERIVSAANAAREKLVSPNNLPMDTAERMRAAHDAVVATATEVERINRQRREQMELAKTQSEWADHKRSLNQSTPQGDADDHARRAARAQRRVAELDAELPAAIEAAERATNELRRLEAAALKV